MANRTQLALWVQYELGLPASEIEPRCMLEQLPLANRGTQRQLSRLWRDRRLLLQVCSHPSAPAVPSAPFCARHTHRTTCAYCARCARCTVCRPAAAHRALPPPPQGVLMSELKAHASGRPNDARRAENAFRRKLSSYAHRVQRLSPSRHEKVP